MVTSRDHVVSADAGVRDIRVRGLVGHHQGVVVIELIIDPGVESKEALWSLQDLIEGRNGQRRRIEHDAIGNGTVIRRVSLEVKCKRRVLGQRSSNTAFQFP